MRHVSDYAMGCLCAFSTLCRILFRRCCSAWKLDRLPAGLVGMVGPESVSGIDAQSAKWQSHTRGTLVSSRIFDPRRAVCGSLADARLLLSRSRLLVGDLCRVSRLHAAYRHFPVSSGA